MANLDDLKYKSITDMDNDEALELLRLIRLSRRIPVKKVTKRKSVKKPKANTTSLKSSEALKILELLGGK